MREDRAYRSAIPVAEAATELLINRGQQFDAEIVDRYLAGLVRRGIIPREVVRDQ